MERIDQVKLQNIDQVNAHGFVYFELDGVDLIVKGDTVDSVKIVFIVEINIQAVHYHDHFVINRWAATFGINDKSTIQTFSNVPGQREDMTVIEMDAEGFSIKFIDE